MIIKGEFCLFLNKNLMLWVLIRIGEAILMSTHNICFYGELTKIIHQLPSNTVLTHVSVLLLVLLTG